jgi:ABC-type sugar transport system substrate-binding protein
MKIWAAGLAALATVIICPGAASAERAPVRVAAVLNALDNPFFVAIYEGITSEAQQLGARTTVRAATSNADLAGQAAQVRAVVAAGSDCYVINPITATNLIAALRGVRRPIVNVDSPFDRAAAKRAGIPLRTYIGTDDFAAGRLAGAKMASLLRRHGQVALIGGLAANVNSGLRLGGFERGLQGTAVEVVARINADYRRADAEVAAEQILRRYPRLAGFFAASDLMALGAADAVRTVGRTGRVVILGLDGIPEALAAIRAGTISGTVAQYPWVMGRMAVEGCVAAARGAALPRRVEAPIALVTLANVGRAIAAVPRPFRPYSDPFRRILRKQH